MMGKKETERSNRITRILIAVAAAVFLAALVASILILRPARSRIVEIVQDDRVLYTIDLNSAEDEVFTVFYPQEDGTTGRNFAAGDGAGMGDGLTTWADTARDGSTTQEGISKRSNTITVQGGQIWVSEAECPDHTCMKMGKLWSERLPIVCLPNHLIIRFAE